MEYLVVKYRTLMGTRELIDLGDHVYGEWIIYDKKIPKYHVSCFGSNLESDNLIRLLLESKNWTIERLIKYINNNFNEELNFGRRPLIQLVVSTEMKKLKLEPLPIKWLNKIKTTANNGEHS